MIKAKVHGLPTEYEERGTVRTSISAIQGNIPSAGNMLMFGTKFLACFIVLVGAVFCYLFLTMEKDAPLVNEITSSQALVNSRKELIPKLEKIKNDFLTQRNVMEKEDKMSREEKVMALDLEMKIKNMDEKITQAEAEITINERKITETQEKLDSLRKKSFIKRLLKQ